ncbi:MAG TPA: cytochrome c3 family protein [Burkholderiales bacterium]|nr:cytochrome c3 family protein [Burkholderiales bacterium]
MTVLVTHVRRNARGQSQRDQRRLTGTLLGIGRGTRNEIHLPDARVALNHARLSIHPTGARVEAVDGTIELNGRRVQTADLAIGDAIHIGAYEITVDEPPADLPLALTVAFDPKFASGGNMLRRVLMLAPRVSKRRLSYLAFFGVLLLALVVPLAADLLGPRGPAEPGSAKAIFRELVPVVAGNFMQAWNPGTLSRGHQVFGANCRACHEFPFVQVRDSGCVSCHKTIREHVPKFELTGSRGIEFARTRCAECHRDHKGKDMAPRAQELCADCHADIKSTAPHAQSQNVTDFAEDHPQFRLTLVDADRPETTRRVRQAAQRPAEMVERSNLKFNHALHMNPAGIRDPQEKRTVLSCGDCHERDEGGRLIAPIDMERHCRQCHSLAFEPKVTRRQVPHGPVEDVVTTLREFYARLVLGEVPPGVTPPPDLIRMRPGAVLDYQERQQALRIADERAQRVLRELFKERAVCSTCHYTQPDANGGYAIAKVRVARVWMPQALFSHAKHATQSCTTCHDVTRSKNAADIAMPNVAKCRECHVGARPVMGKVTSDCASCHKFHAGRDFWHWELQTQMQARGRK